MTPKKTVYYSDPLNDDFADNGIRTTKVGNSFRYLRRSYVWNGCARFLYYVIAIPIVFVISKCYLGVRFENRRVLRKIKKQGYFLYANHTRGLDAFIPALAAYPRRAFLISNPDAVSIPFLRNIVLMLGAVPVPTETHALKKFHEALYTHYERHRAIAIYPEAHIWPFYTGIRPFPDTSFSYPVKVGAPAIAMVTTYRVRRGLFSFCKKPGMTITLSEPFYPDASLSPRKAREKLRNEVHDFMVKTVNERENAEYIRYVYRPADTDSEVG